MKTYKLKSDTENERVLTAPDIIEAIKVFNAFKVRHVNDGEIWAMVLGTMDKFPSLLGG